ncbi:hypothetical protein GCM10011418_27200 [Sphingobacterium alkalisoli]|nr:DUF4998 domain-containing protein [Sphingobacterium alkalisoli]GGH21387.1 hypothetical protein GCM10011418_27200 [Sphingobacterium alkalisoli]
MDDWKKYVEEGEISYTGKLDSLRIYSGKNRVKIEGLFISDPKVIECRVFWNGRKDSVSIPVNRTQNTDTLRLMLENMTENVHNFEVVTFDTEGNKSITVYGIGNVYGERYQQSIFNRPIANNSLKAYDNTFTATFGNVDRTLGIFATEIRYVDTEGVNQTIRLDIDDKDVALTNVKIDESMSFRSLYLPDTLCLDTFYTAYTDFNPSLTYYRNLGYPFTATNISGRWGVLQDWTSNASANAISGRGSWDNNTGVGVLSAEAGWGTPNINNGKIYQATTLPAGKYKVDIEFRRNNVTANVDATNNLVYFVVTNNGSIPNVADVLSSDKLGYYNLAWINDAYRVVSFEFDNPVTQEVTIGYVANLMSSSNQYFNVRGMSVSLVE